MAMIRNGSIQYYQFDSFSKTPITHAVFTRHGGVSPQPWASLNVGGSIGDTRENVLENIDRSFSAVGRELSSRFDVWQVHGVDVICTDVPRPIDSPYPTADAIITDRPEITLYMRFADCVPILLVDPVHRVVGLVHSGWQGTVKRTAFYAIEAMIEKYHSVPANIHAGIGPSICKDHYPVGDDVVSEVQKAFNGSAKTLLEDRDGKLHFDLWKANRLVLSEAGVTQIEVAGICTASNLGDWFSHRGEHGKTGRFGALIALT